MKFKLPYHIKKNLFDEILELDNPFNLDDTLLLPDFLLRFLDLKNLPSEDDRYINAYDDAIQHLVNNNDWSLEFVFEKRFRIIENDNLFRALLEEVLNGSLEYSVGIRIALIDRYLTKFGYRVNKQFDESLRVKYIIDELNDEFTYSNYPENKIPFFVISRNFKNSIDEYPCFTLKHVAWNDFGYETSFELRYCKSKTLGNHIGRIKILNTQNPITVDEIDKKFYKLDKRYCSLIQYEEFYLVLKNILKDEFYSFLIAINDVGVFPTICEKYESEEGFQKSLLRNEKETEKILRRVRYRLEYGDISNFFNFEYIFKPIYSNFHVRFNFDFDTEKIIPKRLFCIIGKNGVGKTLMIRNLIYSLSQKNEDNVLPRLPLYGKTILVSYSYFDLFDKIANTNSFNFSFCGLFDLENNKPLSSGDLIVRICKSIDKIEEKDVIKRYFLTLNQFLDKEILYELFIVNYLGSNVFVNFDSDFLDEVYDVKILKEKLVGVLNKLSSGHKSLMFIVTEIVANVRYNSFIIFDEPETHLHPNAITEFMNVIMELLQEFDSFGIIATHSPLVVREVFSDSIYVLEKEKEVPRVRKLEFETFGENLSTITNEIFGNRDVPKYFYKSIKELVDKGKSYKEIENELQGELPLNLNLKILIKSLVKNRDEESK